MAPCPVHDNPHEGPPETYPTLDDLEQELTDHLGVLLGIDEYKESHSAAWPCGYCHEEMLIRLDDIEGLLVEEDHMNRWVDEECTCPEDSPNRLTFWAAIRQENQGVSA